jgi:hypothetical protein
MTDVHRSLAGSMAVRYSRKHTRIKHANDTAEAGLNFAMSGILTGTRKRLTITSTKIQKGTLLDCAVKGRLYQYSHNISRIIYIDSGHMFIDTQSFCRG